MTTTLRSIVAMAAVATLLGCASFSGIATLRGADAASVDQAPAQALLYAGKRPGSGAPIARSFKEQPPLIPHAIDNFDEITVADNQCLECHSPETAPAKKAPKVADSHLAKGAVTMDRYQCNTCHVAQVDAPPLVRSTFATR
ncbi:MAG: nitrate reductase cytochrome c-type subunit [Rubrivivax sp.]